VYNKLFSKIVTSSVWLSPTDHRIVWVTLLALMDQDGFVPISTVANLAHTARVSEEATQAAVTSFEGPDAHDPEQEYQGRRIEKVPGGWMVLNAKKYAAMSTGEKARELTRIRVQEHRQRKRGNVTVTPVTPVTIGNENVTPSDQIRSDHIRSEEDKSKNGVVKHNPVEQKLDDGPVQRVFDHWRTEFQHPRAVLDAKRKRVIQAALKAFDEATLLIAISGYRNSPHHMGENEARTVYDDITLFLRDANHIENGLRFSRGPPAPAVSAVTRARQKLQESINANRRVVSEQSGSSQGDMGSVTGVLRGCPDPKV
jgi:hypothetical protein